MNDAFGTAHRAHSSMMGEGFDVKACGMLVAKELEAFGQVRHMLRRRRMLGRGRKCMLGRGRGRGRGCGRGRRAKARIVVMVSAVGVLKLSPARAVCI